MRSFPDVEGDQFLGIVKDIPALAVLGADGDDDDGATGGAARLIADQPPAFGRGAIVGQNPVGAGGVARCRSADTVALSLARTLTLPPPSAPWTSTLVPSP